MMLLSSGPGAQKETKKLILTRRNEVKKTTENLKKGEKQKETKTSVGNEITVQKHEQ